MASLRIRSRKKKKNVKEHKRVDEEREGASGCAVVCCVLCGVYCAAQHLRGERTHGTAKEVPLRVQEGTRHT